MMATIGMKISGSGIASIGLRCIKERRELWQAKTAISCLHDALLAVARGIMSPSDVAGFFWSGDLEKATYIGGVIVIPPERPIQVGDFVAWDGKYAGKVHHIVPDGMLAVIVPERINGKDFFYIGVEDVIRLTPAKPEKNLSVPLDRSTEEARS